MVLRIFLLLSILFFSTNTYADEYIARVNNNRDWHQIDLGLNSGNLLVFKNDKLDALVMVEALKDGHFYLETSPLAVYLNDRNTKYDGEKKLSSFTAGGDTYTNVTSYKYKCLMGGLPTDIDIWQFVKDKVEYTIIAVANLKDKTSVSNFIKTNLKLLPLPEITEEKFINDVTEMNKMLTSMGGGKMDTYLLMISCNADKDKKEFTRVYRFMPGADKAYMDVYTSAEGSSAMVNGEAESVIMVKNAIELGYTIVVVWKDKNNRVINSHRFKF